MSLFDSNGNSITRENNTALASMFFHLLSVYHMLTTQASIHLLSTNKTKIFPIQILVPDGIPLPDDLTRWIFVFSHTAFEYGGSYELTVIPGIFTQFSLSLLTSRKVVFFFGNRIIFGIASKIQNDQLRESMQWLR